MVWGGCCARQAALLFPWKGNIWWAARRGGTAQRRRAAPRERRSAQRRRACGFCAKCRRGRKRDANRFEWQFKAQPSVRAARAAPRCRACVCEGSEAWRADTLVILPEDPHSGRRRAFALASERIRRGAVVSGVREECSPCRTPLRAVPEFQRRTSSSIPLGSQRQARAQAFTRGPPYQPQKAARF